MNAHEIVSGFRHLGYCLSLEGSDVRFKFAGKGAPSRDDVQTLLSFLKQNKSAVVEFLRQEEIESVPEDGRFQNAFDQTVGEMAAGHKSGLFSRARQSFPGEYGKFERVENRINQYWDTGNFESFQKDLREWVDIYKNLLQLFREK